MTHTSQDELHGVVLAGNLALEQHNVRDYARFYSQQDGTIALELSPEATDVALGKALVAVSGLAAKIGVSFVVKRAEARR